MRLWRTIWATLRFLQCAQSNFWVILRLHLSRVRGIGPSCPFFTYSYLAAMFSLLASLSRQQAKSMRHIDGIALGPMLIFSLSEFAKFDITNRFRSCSYNLAYTLRI